MESAENEKSEMVNWREKRGLARSSNLFKRKLRKRVVLGTALIGGMIAVIVVWLLVSGSKTSTFDFLRQNPLVKRSERVNVLLLGNAGGTHDGAQLTDSIIVASFEDKTKKATLFSIPRDVWYDPIKEKVNAIYEVGARNGEGLKYSKEKFGELMGLKIDYAVRLDFNGFAKAVDLVEGIDVEVPKTFDDYVYPIEGKEKDLCGNREEEVELSEEQAKILKEEKGTKRKVILTPENKLATESGDFACRFDHIHFDRGLTHMNGAIALTFVRSRQGTNGEGSDFARSRRQQLVMEAFRNKVLSIETLFNPQKVFGLIDTFGQSFETDIPSEKFLEIYTMVKSITQTKSVVLGSLENGKTLFISPPVPNKYGAFVLVPPNDDFSKVQLLVKETLEGTQSAQLASPAPGK